VTEEIFIQEIQPLQGIIHKVCLLYTYNQEDRDDLFQEILLQAWKSYGNFRGESKFSTWLYQIALNTAISWFRKNVRKPDNRSIQFPLFEDPWADRETEAQFNELYTAISKMNKIDKAIVTLFLEDYDYKTIGQILGITANNVAVKMNRIRTQLKETLSATH
jgi:RNA polymerase sigma-70 factor (ECF subfamily)